MNNTLTYFPGKGISIGDTLLLWNTDRQQVRTLINDDFEVNDIVIDLSNVDNGDTSHNIVQRRDIYESYHGDGHYLFLNYNANDQLSEVEVHHGFTISIDNVSIDFSMDLDNVVELLDSISNDKRKLEDGEYFYKSLKLTIASYETMGGEGNDLGYFYCGKDLSYLSDE